jgi:hypothetical protein
VQTISDADRALVKITDVSSGVKFGGPQGFLNTRVVHFSVGERGPFSIAFALTEYTPETVWAAIAQEISTLRGIGAL